MAKSNELQRFAFPDTGQGVRTVLIDGVPWLVGRDVALALGYSNPRDALAKHVPDRHKGASRIATPSGDQEMTVISESGMYRLVMRSNAEYAERFQEWVTDEVLPAIRRTGSYAVQQFAIPASYAEALELAAKQAREIEEQAVLIAELEPDAARARQTMDADGLALVGTVAKRFGLQERKLREFLYAQGVLIRHGMRRNEPMARYVQSGYFELKVTLIGEPVRERSVTYVTPRGESWIWKRLVDAGVCSGPIPGQQLELV